MTVFQTISVLLALAAAGSYINHRFMRLPATIGQMVFALVMALIVMILHGIGWFDLRMTHDFVSQIDFSHILLHGMLSFLLFAGALHINVQDLKQVKGLVGILATLGVVVATLLIGTTLWLAAHQLGFELSYPYALIFGALIAPTDPIAVLSILKQTGAPKKLYTQIGGESLFNDGISIVVFLLLLDIATHNTIPTWHDTGLLLLRETCGGVLFGGVLGWIVFRLIATIDDYKTEVMLTLATASSGYALAEMLHISAPIAIVVAGLIIGNHGRLHAMSDVTRARLDEFWELIDEILNAVLFMLIGFEIMTLNLEMDHMILGLLAIGIVLAGRFLSVSIPVAVLRLISPLRDRGLVRLLTWGGLRGGLSIAMALSLPESPEKTILIPVTYIVVIFSILVQGLSFSRVTRRILHTDLSL